MSSLEPPIYCTNPACTNPENTFGQQVCEGCNTPLSYRYLWVTGAAAAQLPPKTLVANRYYVTAPQIWLDTQPAIAPYVPTDLPAAVLPYLYLYPHRLHVPDAYGFCPLGEEPDAELALLLEHSSLDGKGNLFPTLSRMWGQVTAVRQVYWLWQMLQLWSPLGEAGVSASLISTANVRVEGWRLRLRELLPDGVAQEPESGDDRPTTADDPPTQPVVTPSLAQLAGIWLTLLPTAQAAIAEPLRVICAQMQAESVDETAIASQLNQLLLEQSAQLPLRIQVFGATDTGPQRSHNEDACFPVTPTGSHHHPPDELIPRLALVCDGIGGHEGGEVASQLAVQTLQLQMKALLAEVAQQEEVISPNVLVEQIEATLRIVNNLIASQNDAQGREARRRMGTTLVMALQIPQRVRLGEGREAANSHELYLANVGDSRAYWITPRYCHCLTVDDDVTTREVRLGRSLYWEAMKRPDAGALIQALGTRDGEFLRPTVRRFILEEDGLLLLCSDGLSDNNCVEQSWQQVAEAVFKDRQPLDETVQNWIALANQKNGHDNTSIVLTHCHVSSPFPELQLPGAGRLRRQDSESELSEASAALLYGDETPVAPAKAGRQRGRLVAVGLALVLLLGGTAGGLALWRYLNPIGFQQTLERLGIRLP